MPVFRILFNPIDEVDTQLIGRMTTSHEFVFIQLHRTDKLDQRRNRRFADANGRDAGRLEERYLAVTASEKAAEKQC